MIKSIDLAKYCLKTAKDKKAINPVIMEVKGLTDIADYFVVCSGSSTRQIKAISDSIIEKLKKNAISALHYEADAECCWMVLDYVDVIVHIFEEHARAFYKVEKLWGDAKLIGTDK